MPARRLASKVPPTIAAGFWVAKILSTGMGEATSDWLHLDISSLYVGAAIGVVAFIIAMALQFATSHYVSWLYWFAVCVVAVVGTMGADGMHLILGVPYWASSSFWLIVLAVILLVWHRTEHTLSIHSIVTPRREVFYWLTVIATFALGTAVGDLTAVTFHLGYLASGLLFTAAICIPLVAWRFFHMNAVFAFWFAYILTRPLGASYADWIAWPRSAGALGLGHGVVAAVGAALVLGCVAYLTLRERAQARHDVGLGGAVGK
ncbi:MAG: COG4705 family protein [Candidatus Dormibacteraceae bacterium]